MEKAELQERLRNALNTARAKGLAKTQKEFAALIGYNETSVSKALKGEPIYLTDTIVSIAESIVNAEPEGAEDITVVLLPWEAKGGAIGDFVDGIQRFHCERIISPIRGADYAIQVNGDSMSPEYPSGSVVLIKEVNEAIFIEWGKVYVLDTPNGAIMKKVRKTDDPEVIECVSINPAYQPFTLECRYINHWFKVLMVMAAK